MQSVSSNAVYNLLSGYRLKLKRVTGTTNSNAILWSGNSNIGKNDCIVFANCLSHVDYMYIVGYGGGNGVWLKVVNYDYTPIINTNVIFDVLYLERIA